MDVTLIQVLALLYVALCAVVVVFQFCLIAGAPWGHLTQGGKYSGALPNPARTLAAMSIVLMCLMAASILSAANLWISWPQWTSWLALGIQVVSVIVNIITPSRPERMLWAPITLAMLVSATIIVFN